MSYHILSKELSNPELKEILQVLNAFFQSTKVIIFFQIFTPDYQYIIQ